MEGGWTSKIVCEDEFLMRREETCVFSWGRIDKMIGNAKRQLSWNMVSFGISVCMISLDGSEKEDTKKKHITEDGGEIQGNNIK